MSVGAAVQPDLPFQTIGRVRMIKYSARIGLCKNRDHAAFNAGG
jgi:hypothetical protein